MKNSDGTLSISKEAKNAKVETGSSVMYSYGTKSVSQVYKITASW